VNVDDVADLDAVELVVQLILDQPPDDDPQFPPTSPAFA
jgi:hypothetical protein